MCLTLFNILLLSVKLFIVMRHHIYKPVKSIGRGSFGRVELVESEADGKNYVMKKIEARQQNKQSILKQVKIMRNLSHQYVIRYFESFQDEENNVCIIMEYAENGELEQYLNNRRASNHYLTEDEVLEWFIQLCLGLKYIHDNKILHRDLKCENIFINSQNELKIGDFGISKLMNQTFDMAKTKIGTPYVMAPEIWENKMYNQKSDIWSLGCILYKMMTLNHAFEAKNPGSYILKITSGVYNPIIGNYSDDLKKLIKSMLSLQAHDRPSTHSILQLDFIKKKLNQVLENTIRKYDESLQNPILQKQKNSLSNHRLLPQKRSFSSLSNSSLLTSKNMNTFNNTKMVQMKQSYPILVQEVKQLKKQLEEQQKEKEEFVEQSQKILEKIRKGKKIQIDQAVNALEHKLTSYLYP